MIITTGTRKYVLYYLSIVASNCSNVRFFAKPYFDNFSQRFFKFQLVTSSPIVCNISVSVISEIYCTRKSDICEVGRLWHDMIGSHLQHLVTGPQTTVFGSDAIGEYLLNDDAHLERKKGKLGAYAIKRVAAGAHLPTPWLCEPTKRPDDRADYCLDCSFLTLRKHRVETFSKSWFHVNFSMPLRWSLTIMDSRHNWLSSRPTKVLHNDIGL